MTKVETIQLIVNGILALATIGLVIVTAIYACITRKMADSMKLQSNIMVEGYERNIAPIFKSTFNYGSANENVAKKRFLIQNYGKGLFTVVKVKTKVWKNDNPNIILQEHDQIENIIVPPLPAAPVIDISFGLNRDVSSFFPDKENRVLFESIFIVSDIKGREYSFSSGIRSFF